MKDTITIEGGKLHLYASGDGSLTFTWAATVYPYPSLSRKVSANDVTRYLNLKQNKERYPDNTVWKDSGGNYHLIPNVERVGEYQLKDKGEIYLYRPFLNDEGKIVRGMTKVLFDIGVNEYMEVKNLSIRARLFFFLENENYIPQYKAVE